MRKAESKLLNQMFIDRWSPRAFLSDEIPQEHIEAIFEAARWSPSCFNEQPWAFVYSTTTGKNSKFLTGLVDANQKWAFKAPLLIYVFAKKHFDANNKVNDWSKFDTGASWMALNLQAEMLGYKCHGMAGIHKDKVFELTNMPTDKYDLICAVAIGKQGEVKDLDKDLASKESPSGRNSKEQFVFKDAYKK